VFKWQSCHLKTCNLILSTIHWLPVLANSLPLLLLERSGSLRCLGKWLSWTRTPVILCAAAVVYAFTASSLVGGRSCMIWADCLVGKLVSDSQVKGVASFTQDWVDTCRRRKDEASEWILLVWVRSALSSLRPDLTTVASDSLTSVCCLYGGTVCSAWSVSLTRYRTRPLTTSSLTCCLPLRLDPRDHHVPLSPMSTSLLYVLHHRVTTTVN